MEHLLSVFQDGGGGGSGDFWNMGLLVPGRVEWLATVTVRRAEMQAEDHVFHWVENGEQGTDKLQAILEEISEVGRPVPPG